MRIASVVTDTGLARLGPPGSPENDSGHHQSAEEREQQHRGRFGRGATGGWTWRGLVVGPAVVLDGDEPRGAGKEASPGALAEGEGVDVALVVVARTLEAGFEDRDERGCPTPWARGWAQAAATTGSASATTKSKMARAILGVGGLVRALDAMTSRDGPRQRRRGTTREPRPG